MYPQVGTTEGDVLALCVAVALGPMTGMQHVVDTTNRMLKACQLPSQLGLREGGSLNREEFERMFQ